MPWFSNLADLPSVGPFSNTLLAMFDIFFRSKVFHRFVPKNRPKMTCGRVFLHNFISKANLKKSKAKFFSSQILLAEETKKIVSGKAGFQLKSDRIWVIFAYFHLFRHLKVIQPFQKYAKTFYFRQAFRQKKPFEDSSSGFKIRF